MTGCFDFRLRASPSVDLDRIHIDHDPSKFSMSFSKLFRSRSDGSVKTARSQSEGPTPRARSRPLRTSSPVASASAPASRRRYVRVVRSDDARDTRHPSGDNSSSTHVIIRSRSYSSTDRMRLKKSASADAAAEVTTGPRGAIQQRPASSYTPSTSGHTILKKYNHSLDAGTGTLDGATGGGGVPAEVSPPNSKHTSFREEVEILEYETHGKALLVKCVTHTKKLNYEEDDDEDDEDDSLNIDESFDDDLESTDFSLTEIQDESLASVPSSAPSSVPSSLPIPTPSSVPIPAPASVPSSVPILAPSSVPNPSPSSVPIPSSPSVPSFVPILAPSSVPISAPYSVPIPVPSSVPIPSSSSVPSPVPYPARTSSLAFCIGKLAMEHDAVAEPASLDRSMAQDSRRNCVNRKTSSFAADCDSISAFDGERGLSVGTPSSAPQNISDQSTHVVVHSSKTSIGFTNIDESCQVADEQRLPASKSCPENGQSFSSTAISCRGSNSGSLYAHDSCPDPAHMAASLSTCPSISVSSNIQSSVCNESSSTSLCQPTTVQLADTKQSQPDHTLDFHALVTRGASRNFTDAK